MSIAKVDEHLGIWSIVPDEMGNVSVTPELIEKLFHDYKLLRRGHIEGRISLDVSAGTLLSLMHASGRAARIDWGD